MYRRQCTILYLKIWNSEYLTRSKIFVKMFQCCINLFHNIIKIIQILILEPGFTSLFYYYDITSDLYVGSVLLINCHFKYAGFCFSIILFSWLTISIMLKLRNLAKGLSYTRNQKSILAIAYLINSKQ